MSILLYVDAVEWLDDRVRVVFNVVVVDCVDLMDLVVLRDGERTGEGANLWCDLVVDLNLSDVVVDVDDGDDAVVLIEEE